MKALLGRKLGMTQLFDEDGNVARVTIVEAGPCVVTQVRTGERDGYQAVQLGFGAAKHPAKPQAGHYEKDGVTPRYLKDVRADRTPADVELVEGEGAFKPGDTLDVTQFEVGDKVMVTGTSKGKGFAGTIKRHNFHRGPKSHGSHNYRQPGSIGSMYPQHVFKGIKMAGQMGAKQVTTRGLKVVSIDPANNILAIKGALPGPRKGIVMIKEAA